MENLTNGSPMDDDANAHHEDEVNGNEEKIGFEEDVTEKMSEKSDMLENVLSREEPKPDTEDNVGNYQGDSQQEEYKRPDISEEVDTSSDEEYSPVEFKRRVDNCAAPIEVAAILAKPPSNVGRIAYEEWEPTPIGCEARGKSDRLEDVLPREEPKHACEESNPLEVAATIQPLKEVHERVEEVTRVHYTTFEDVPEVFQEFYLLPPSNTVFERAPDVAVATQTTCQVTTVQYEAYPVILQFYDTMTDSGNDETVCKKSKTYHKISDVQKIKLRQYYDDGMKSCVSANSERIRRAAEETQLTVKEVKKWIGNEKKRRKVCSGSEPTQKRVKIPTGSRGSHSYNVFCSEYFKSDKCKDMSLSQKNKVVSMAWKDLSLEEKEKYKQSADRMKSPDVINLNEDQKSKLISVHRKNLQNEDNSGQVFNFGSSAGYSFLCLNPDINTKFTNHFACNTEKYTYKDVQQLFNAKYSEAIQKPGSKVPYLHGGFTVENLPEGIHFKKPFHYGAKQLKAIMENKDVIKFNIQSVPTTTCASDETTNPRPSEILDLLSKLVDRNTAERAVNMMSRIVEEEVEVVNVTLDQGERLLLNECSQFFDVDAWHAVGANIQHTSETQGLIVPVCPESADEDFWLFYTVENPSKFVKAPENYKLKGYWLNLEEQSKYKLLRGHQDSVKILNLIKNGAYGPLYFLTDMNISDDQYFYIPEVFDRAIHAALRDS